MQQSNLYIITFTILMTIFFGTLLSLTRMTLEPRQKKQEEIDTKMKEYGDAISKSSKQIDIQKLTDIVRNDLLKEKLINWLEENSEVKEKTSKSTKTDKTTKTKKTPQAGKKIGKTNIAEKTSKKPQNKKEKK